MEFNQIKFEEEFIKKLKKNPTSNRSETMIFNSMRNRLAKVGCYPMGTIIAIFKNCRDMAILESICD